MQKIKEFQEQNGLTADGIIGPKTLSVIKTKLNIKTNEELAHFMGQCHHETGGFSVDSENLNYSAKGLLGVFKKYFPTEEMAKLYERKQEMIGNRVYASRMGNGDEKSGEGFKFKGRGALQLTGKNNYKLFSDFVKDPAIMENTSLVATKYFFESALFFFNRNNLWKYCTSVNDSLITTLSKAINIGNPKSSATPHGLDDRINQTNKYYNMMKS